ncbi:WD40 repeat-like protein [Phlegmacium glaucopus]|nr:WD40 repeat-like protein [Phlegmacium glaucopus]
MSSERPSKNNRITKAIKYVKGRFSSPLPLSHPPTPLSINLDPSPDNRMATTDAGTSNLPLTMVSVDHAATAVVTTEAHTVSLPDSVPSPASTPIAPRRQFSSASSQAPETPSTYIAPNIHGAISAFQGAHDVYLHQPTINMANSIYMNAPSDADGNEQLNSRNMDALRERLLPRAQFAEYDAASQRNACTENTRKAILESLRAWASDDTTTKVYWLNGMAGTGKTTIAYSFSEILREKNSLGGTFFSSHLRVDTSDVHCIIPTVSLQLAQYLPSLSHLILDVVKTDPSPDCTSWRISKQFLNFIVRPLTAYKDSTRGGVVPVIVLDALDECSDQSLVAELLSVILKHSKSLPVKFFITSRPEIVLKETFDHSWDHSNFILHEVEKEIVKADIELYIKACLLVGQVKHNKHNWPPQAELESLVNMSGSLFVYAATVCKYIAQKGSSSMPQRLSDVVNSKLEATSGVTHPLDILYERILDAAYAFTNKQERMNIVMILTAVVYVYNPLSMTAISALMEMPIEHTVAALSSLHSLIHIPSQDSDMPISILHASFHDFISNQILSSKYYLDPYISHKHLALQCLSLMEKEWSEKERVSYLAERKCGEISESLAYACGSWVSHFTYADNSNEIDELKHFFQRYLLRWMDCLSILGKLGMAMQSLHELGSWANHNKLLKMTVIDAERFLKENFEFIKTNSLEGCPSALIWLPEKSDIWKTYGSRMDCPWKLHWGRRKAWRECEAKLKGHSGWVRSAVFSPDGMHIVSASDDTTARIWNTATGECEAELKGHSETVFSAVFSPDGMHIVSASGDNTVQIWNTTSGECETELKGHSERVHSAVFSPDGRHIVSASYDNTARIWNTITGVCEAELKGHSETVCSAVFSPDGMNIVSASYDHTAQIWNTAIGECEAELKGHSGIIHSAVFSPDGMHIVSASSDNTARIWNAVTGECEAELKGHLGIVGSAVFSPDGMHIVSASFDQTARIWNVATGECEAKLKGHSGWVFSAVYSPDGMHIASASNDNTAWIWNTATWECEVQLKGHSGWVRSAVFSPDGMHIVSASDDNTARIWNTATGECEAELKGHSETVFSAVFSPDGMHIVSASGDNTARIWNTTSGECETELKGHLSWVSSAVFSPDSMHIVSASYDNTARIWNVATGVCKAELKGHSDTVCSAVFSPDGMHIVSASHDNTAWIWSTATGECEAELKGHSGVVYSAVFSPDGMYIVSASSDKTAWIWNAATGECEEELKGHSDWVYSAVFSPDGMYIVSASHDNTAQIWNTATGECEAELRGHSSLVSSAIFSPDHMHIVSASYDKTAQIWSTATGECEAELKGHSGWVRSAAFSPNGMHIVSASDDKTARIWNTATGECEAELKGHLGSVGSAIFSSDSMCVVSASDDKTVRIWNTATGEFVLSSIPDGVFIHHHADGKIHPSLQLSFLNIYQDTIFHTINLHNIWIPSPFRKPTCVSYHSSKICLGYGTGEILLLEVCMALIPVFHIVI